MVALLAPRGVPSEGWKTLLEQLSSVEELELVQRASAPDRSVYHAAWLVKARWSDDDVLWAMASIPGFHWVTEQGLLDLAALDDASVRRLATAVVSASSNVSVRDAVVLARGVESGRLEATQLILDGMGVDEAFTAARLLARPSAVSVRRASSTDASSDRPVGR